MELRAKPVSTCLDKKMKIMGYEIPDLLAIFMTLSILNFLFGSTGLKIYLVWIPSIALAITIRITKRGKPDNYLIHWLRFQFKPGILSAFALPSDQTAPPQLRKRNVA